MCLYMLLRVRVFELYDAPVIVIVLHFTSFHIFIHFLILHFFLIPICLCFSCDLFHFYLSIYSFIL